MLSIMPIEARLICGSWNATRDALALALASAAAVAAGALGSHSSRSVLMRL